jgi:tripartite-type tricarboxylate transporter receptor subunit TctC
MNQALKFLIVVTVASTLLLRFAPCFAQDAYPTRPIRMVVGYPPGGATDVAGRLVANKIAPLLGQPVVMDNKPGVGSTLGTLAVAQAAPDGYTLLMGNTTALSIAPHLYKKLGYEPRRDLVPVALIGRVPLVLFVHPSVPATDLQGLVALLKKNPGKYDYATFGNGSSAHLTMEMLKLSADVDVRHVPYKGSSAALNDVLGGQVLLAIDTFQSAQPHFLAGKLRPIAMSGEARSSLAPQLPTFAELGYPKMTLSPWYGVFVPAGTPSAIVEKLASAISRSMRTSDMQAQLATQGAELMVLMGASARDFLDKDDARWAEAARISGAQLD